MSLWFLLFIPWYIIGVASFVYWWTKDFDFTNHELGFAMLAGFLGPMAFITGASIHTKHTIIKRR